MAEIQKLKDIHIGSTVTLPYYGECIYYGEVDGYAILRPKEPVPLGVDQKENRYNESNVFAFLNKREVMASESMD